jgi:hypothetical protein
MQKALEPALGRRWKIICLMNMHNGHNIATIMPYYSSTRSFHSIMLP